MMYQTQTNVFACVDKVANLASKLDISVVDAESGENEVDYDDPYYRLMRSPCYTVDPYAFYHWLFTTYEIYGEAYLLKNRDEDGSVLSLQPMHPAMTEIYRNPEGGLLYRFMGMPNEIFAEEDVIPFRRYNPTNTMRGLSRLEPLRLTLMNEDGARRAQISWWENMCRPSMVLSTPKKLGDNGRERLYAAVSASQSSADSSGGTLVLEDEVTATRMQLGAEELQYIQSRTFNREEVCSTYDIPPQAVQFMTMGDVGISSYQAVARDIYKYSIAPRVHAFESVFRQRLGSEKSMGYGRSKFKFLLASQTRGDVEMLAPAAVQLVQSGIAKPIEMREWLELGKNVDDVADQLYANQALQLLGEANVRYTEQGQLAPPNAQATNTQSPRASGDLPKQLPEATDKAQKYMREIGGAYGRGQDMNTVVRKMLSQNPDDAEDIVLACRHVAERKQLS